MALILFMLLVVATPLRWFPAYVGQAALLLGVIALSRVPVMYLAKRMVVEVPFVVFALLLPFVAQGERISVLGLEVSEPGLLAAGALLVKATLGVLASLTLAATTEPDDILRGLQRLRVPDLLVQIMGFMIRYLDVVLGEFRRMRVAMASRGHNPTWIGQVKPYARVAGLIFIRSYERGERVYLAMASRGYSGHMPANPGDHAGVGQWSVGLALPALAWLVAGLAWWSL